MTYYGVHVIHQLTQAGRTLVGVLLNCKSETLQHLIPPGLDAVRSCVGLLRRFSGRYVCGLRSGDLMEEFCRLTQIPLEPIRQDNIQNNSRPAWIRPVRKKNASVPRTSQEPPGSQHSSPEGFSPSEFLTDQSKPVVGTSMFQAVASSSLSQSQFSNLNGGSGPQSPAFMDTSGMSMDLLREDAHMYMSPSEVMALFDNGVDVGQMFPTEFSTQVVSDGPPNGSGGATAGGGAYTSSFLKMNGLVPSP